MSDTVLIAPGGIWPSGNTLPPAAKLINGVPSPEKSPVRSAARGTLAEWSNRIEVRFKDWFQQQLGSGLHHPIPYGRNSQWPFAAAGLRDHHPSHGLWLIRLGAKVFPDAAQPFLTAFLLLLSE